MILPCIDIMDNKALQLIQGKDKALEESNIDQLIENFKPFGKIQLIDLDAALGKGSNINLIKEISKKIPCRVGGGIRDIKKAQEVLDAGAEKVIIGSPAFNQDGINEPFLKELIKTITKEKIIIAIDTKNKKIVTKGWTNSTNIKVQ